MAEPVWCFKIMVEAKNPHWLHPTSILDIQRVLAPWDAVDGHMVGAPLRWYLWRWVVDFWKIWAMAESEWCCKVMAEAPTPQTLHPLTMSYIYYIQSVLAPWDAVDGHMGAPLCWYASCGEGWIFVWLSLSDVVGRCFKPPSTPSHNHIIYTKCFITLISCGWAYGMGAPLHCNTTCQGQTRKIKERLS